MALNARRRFPRALLSDCARSARAAAAGAAAFNSRGTPEAAPRGWASCEPRDLEAQLNPFPAAAVKTPLPCAREGAPRHLVPSFLAQDPRSAGEGPRNSRPALRAPGFPGSQDAAGPYCAASSPLSSVQIARLSNVGATAAAVEAAFQPPGITQSEDLDLAALTPAKVVEQLDRYIVGQAPAKRAVAVALRNRWRRRKIEGPMKAEIVPKNLLLIGPTGCGKTEIARRLAKLTDAPFVKVEATKFTEVGFHGRDVDQIIRDLLENAIQLQRTKMRARLAVEVEKIVENRILDILIGAVDGTHSGTNRGHERLGQRETFRSLYREGSLDERRLQLDVPQDMPNPNARPSTGLGSSRDFDFGGGAHAMEQYIKLMEKAMKGQRMERREFTVAEARDVLKLLETEKLLSGDAVVKEAIQVTESDGIVFLDEIDKIVSSSEMRHGADASSEGVQRDLLPIIEGSVVSTRHGNVSTEHILFICSGAFHSVKPSDMLAELQGRLPIRVELKGLTQKDLYRILTEPETNMIRQQQLLMATEGIDLNFTNAAIETIAATAAEVNRNLHNIGARRLHTVMERVVEDISFHAPERAGEKIVIKEEDVKKSLGDLVKRTDLSQYIL